MGQDLIQRWISDFTVFSSIQNSPEKLNAFAGDVVNNHDLKTALFNCLDDLRSHERLLEPICHQLYEYYRCKNDKLNKFTLAFLPSLIGVHLMSVTKPLESRKKFSPIESVLLGIYNLDVIDEDGPLRKRTFKVPLSSKASIYHEPLSQIASGQPQIALTEKTLLRLEYGSSDLNMIKIGPYQEYDRICAGNRMRIMSVLLRIYYQNLSGISKQSYHFFCRFALIILRHGNSFAHKKSFSGVVERTSKINFHEILPKCPSKIRVSADFLIEMLNCLYFILHHDQSDVGMLVLDEIHNRAITNLYGNVILMSSAIKNSLKSENTKPKGETPINSPISNFSSAANITKTATTNASFKTRKLPEDIPIVKTTDNLAPITETPIETRANGIKC